SVQPAQVSPGLPMGLNSPGFARPPVRHDFYYKYDEAGNRSEMGYLGGGVAYFTYYNHDERNQLQELTDPHGQTVYYKHDELGREVEKALPNGVTTYHKYDDASQITDIIHLGPSGVLQSLYYVYDAAGRRTRIDREDGTRIYYQYDDAHRLTREDWLDPSDSHIYGFAYEYDDAGNRKKKTFDGEVTYYDYNNLNQLTAERVLGGEATYYTWTADGEMATKQEAAGWTYYTWDVDESLKKIEAPETTLESKYNSRMQRVWRREDGEAEWLVYDAQKLVAEATTGGLERYYVSEGGSVYSPLVSQLGSQHWFQSDALGTTLGLTDGSGGLSDTFKYEAFGTSLGRTGTTETPYQYVGGYGVYWEDRLDTYNAVDWYVPSVGRFPSLPLVPLSLAAPDAGSLRALREWERTLKKRERQQKINEAVECMRLCGFHAEYELAKRFPVVVVRRLPGAAGWTNPITGTVYIEEDTADMGGHYLFSTLTHEMQHIYDTIVCGKPFRTHKEPWRSDDEIDRCYLEKCAR
ncbi:MAG: hypothetical protein ABFE08_22100, partial [Armatimonadia bacterium]